MKSMFSSLAVTALLFGCGQSNNSSTVESHHSSSGKSDLQADLSQKLGVLGTPFGDHKFDKKLPAQLSADLAEVVSRCLVAPMHFEKSGGMFMDPIKTLCPDEIASPTYDSEKDIEQTTLMLRGRAYTAIAYDGKDSDGGDQTDLAVYDASGSRIGVYTYIYVDTSVLADLGVAGNVGIRNVRDGVALEGASNVKLTEANVSEVFCLGTYAEVSIKAGKLSITSGARIEDAAFALSSSADGRVIRAQSSIAGNGDALLTLTANPLSDGTYNATFIASKNSLHAALNEQSMICKVN